MASTSDNHSCCLWLLALRHYVTRKCLHQSTSCLVVVTALNFSIPCFLASFVFFNAMLGCKHLGCRKQECFSLFPQCSRQSAWADLDLDFLCTLSLSSNANVSIFILCTSPFLIFALASVVTASRSPEPSILSGSLPPHPESSVSLYELSFGTVAGICAGVFIKKGAKAVAFFLGGVFVLLQVCIYVYAIHDLYQDNSPVSWFVLHPSRWLDAYGSSIWKSVLHDRYNWYQESSDNLDGLELACRFFDRGFSATSIFPGRPCTGLEDRVVDLVTMALYRVM